MSAADLSEMLDHLLEQQQEEVLEPLQKAVWHYCAQETPGPWRHHLSQVATSLGWDELHFIAAFAHLNGGDPWQGIKHCSLMQQKTSETYLLMGELASTVDQRRAIMAFREAIKLDGSHLVARFHLAKILYAADQYQEAYQEVSVCCGQAPEALEAFILRGMIALKMNLGATEERATFQGLSAFWQHGQKDPLLLTLMTVLALRTGSRTQLAELLQHPIAQPFALPSVSHLVPDMSGLLRELRERGWDKETVMFLDQFDLSGMDPSLNVR